MAKILFVTTRIPYPPWEGHQIRTYNLLKRVCEDHDVHLVSFKRKDEDAAHADHLKTICRSVDLIDIPADHNKLTFFNTLLAGVLTEIPFVVRKYFAAEMEQKLKLMIDHHTPDLVHIDMLPLAQYLPLCSGIPTVLNDHNVESLLVARRAESATSLPQKIFFSNQSNKLEKFEEYAVRNATEVLACSHDDVAILSRMAENKTVHMVANGVDTQQFVPSDSVQIDTNKMIFVGGMGWFPNKDGMNFFIREALPLIVKQNPDAQLTVVGKSDGLIIPEAMQAHVTATGFVDDFRPYVHAAAVYVLPLRVGSGTRLKLLEAMAMGKAIVSTTIGAEGVELEHEKSILYGDTPEQIANHVITLMKDHTLRDQLGKAAHDLAVAQYDWRALGDQMLDVYQPHLP